MAALVVIGGKGMKDEKPQDDGGDGGDDGEKMDVGEARSKAAKALIRAVKNGDAAGVDDALYAHWKACEQDEPEGGY